MQSTAQWERNTTNTGTTACRAAARSETQRKQCEMQRSAYAWRMPQGNTAATILLTGAEASANVEGVLLAFEHCLNGLIGLLYDS